jgi:hypothetical protein
VFVTGKGRGFAQSIDLTGMTVSRESKFLAENLHIFPAAGKGARYLFIFPRSEAATVQEVADYLQSRLAMLPEPALAEPEVQPALHE